MVVVLLPLVTQDNLVTGYSRLGICLPWLGAAQAAIRPNHSAYRKNIDLVEEKR